MPETIKVWLDDQIGISGQYLWLRRADGTLLNTGGDALTESPSSSGQFSATLDESRTGLRTLRATITGSIAADDTVAAGWLAESTSLVVEDYPQSASGESGDASQVTLLAVEDKVDAISVALAGMSPVEPTGATVFDLLEDIQTGVGNVTGNIVIDTNGVNAIVNALLAQGPTLYTALTTEETTLRVADEYVQQFTGLGDISGRDNIAFALKTRKTDADTAALIYLTEDGGLTRVNGASYATTSNGSIEVDDEVAGDLTVRISSAVTAGLTVGKRQDAVKILIANGNDITKRQGITNVIDGTVAALG